MAISEKLDELAAKLENKTEELAGKASQKLGEKLNEEKRAEYKEKFEGFMENAEKELYSFGTNVGNEIKDKFGKKEDKKEE